MFLRFSPALAAGTEGPKRICREFCRLTNRFPFYHTIQGEDTAAAAPEGRLFQFGTPNSGTQGEWQHHTLAFFAAGRDAAFPRRPRQSWYATSMGAATAIEE